MRIRWTDLAARQLLAVGKYIAQDNPKAATKLLKQIRQTVKLLQRNPFLGRRTEFDGVRELVVQANYLVSYRVTNDTVEILQIWHAAQQRYH
jgi:toxin ParE1/3/4